MSDSQRPDKDEEKRKAFRVLVWAIGLGAGVIALYGIGSASLPEYMALTSVAAGIAGAALLLGGILGFLFGIPRSLQRSGEGESVDGGSSIGYQANTSLEQISDWLTKMLVGVGLTQLTGVPENLWAVAQALGPALGGKPRDAVFALALLLTYAILGFLLGYLWSRLHLGEVFRTADLRAIGNLENRVEQTTRRLEAFQQQSVLDAEAENLVQRQLNPAPDVPPPTQEELNTAVASASRHIKVRVFNQAATLRSETWRDDKTRMELTIPVFRALIHSDVENRYHMNHGQLGFALKDQRQPNWEEAEAELSTAIALREQPDRWLFYEFNRALCRMMLNKEFQAGEPSSDEDRRAIIADLAASWRSDLRPLVQEDSVIARWMRLNKVKETELARAR